jgi:hypothetical protein
MLYLTYHNQGLFYGSGVIKADCKAIIGQRLKQSGMFWSQPGAKSVLDLRCLLMSDRYYVAASASEPTFDIGSTRWRSRLRQTALS